MKKQVGRPMATAYRCGHFERAKRMLLGLRTATRQQVPVGRRLATTNAIEFVNSRIRKKTHNATK